MLLVVLSRLRHNNQKNKDYKNNLSLVPKKPTIVSSKQGATQAGMLGRPTEVIIYRNRTTKNVQDEAISVEV